MTRRRNGVVPLNYLLYKVGGHGREVTQEEKDSHRNKKDSSHCGDNFEVFPNRLEILEKFMDEKPGDKEGETDADGIKGE